MDNKDKMLHLVLSDEKLSSFYGYNADEFQTIQDALNSENPIVEAVAKIIQGVGRVLDKGVFKETYSEVFNYLYQNLR